MSPWDSANFTRKEGLYVQSFLNRFRKTTLNPIHPAQARQLLRNKKAAIYRRYPFTLILRNASKERIIQPLRLKIDPGSQVTGIALINDTTGEVVFAAELKHRGFAIREALTSRRQLRRSRRNRKTRYRQPKLLNRTKPQGWLPPSLQSRIHNIKTWVSKLQRLAPIEAISQELVGLKQKLSPNVAQTGFISGEYVTIMG